MAKFESIPNMTDAALDREIENTKVKIEHCKKSILESTGHRKKNSEHFLISNLKYLNILQAQKKSRKK